MSGKDKPLQPLSSNAVSAKDLARSLGLVKKRPSSSTSRSKDQEKEIKPSQYFAYLIVLDFESTCWKDKKMNFGPEIIEFPAVLLNTSTGELESEFHMFVQPSEHRKLSEFCTELTGITQIQVDEGVPVGTCLMLFGRWLQEMKDKKHFKFPCDQVLNKDKKECMESLTKWCTFVTWSDWDLGTCLKNECYRKQLRMPHPLRSWIDLRATYKSFYSRKPQGLAGALQDLGIKFSGREHSGLDDARNTAHLAWRMICDGSIMQITKSIDGMVEKLWNIVTKRVYSQRNLGRNVSGTTHTITNNEDLFVLKDILALHTKHQVVLSTTEGKNINESLNFNRTQPGNHSGCGEEQNVNGPAKHQSTRKEVDHPCDKMTKIKGKDLVLRIQGNGYSNENYQIGTNLKRRASPSVGSSAMANLSVMSCAASTDMPITTKSLITPATSLSGPNKRPRGCCAGDIRTETPKSSTEGFLLKRGLVKQTLSYNQHTPPSGSHNHHMSLGTGQTNNAAANKPCKASNIEPQAVKTPLFRVLTKQSFLSDRKPIEVLNKANFKACASVTPRTIAQTANKLAARATTVTAKPRSMHLYRPCTTPVGKTYAFTPPPVASSKMNPPITPPVACFNGDSVTPPLCHCGRRTRRRSVINPGPNQGRAFFTCSINHGRSSLGANVDKKKSKSGCNFFRWEVRL